MIDRRRTARVHLERRPLHGLPRRHDRLGARGRGRAGVLAQLQVPPAPRPAHRELPRPGLPWCRSATSRTSAARTACVDRRHGRQLAEHLAVAALRRQGRQRARRAVPRHRLLLQDLHQARAAVARLREGAAHASCTPARCRRTPTAATTTSATPTPTWWSPAAARPGWPPRSAAARAGASVMLVEEEHQLGGHLRWGGAGRPGGAARPARRRSPPQPGIEVLTDSVVAGRYDDNWIADRAAQPARRRRAADQGPGEARWSWRPGLIERPYVFAGNDLPGVMLSTAVRRLVNLYAVQPGQRAVVLTANPEGDAAIADLEAAGVEVAAVVDARRGGDDRPPPTGAGGVRAVELARRQPDRRRPARHRRRVDRADVAAQPCPATDPVYDPRAARFLPDPSRMPEDVLAGGSRGRDRRRGRPLGAGWSEHADARPGRDGGAGRALRDGGAPARDRPAILGVRRRTRSCSRAAPTGSSTSPRTSRPRTSSPRSAEGYDSVELVKRYTTATMGPAQGKLETVNTVAVLAEATGSTIADDGHHHVAADVRAGDPRRAGRAAVRARALLADAAVARARTARSRSSPAQWIRPDHYGDPAARCRDVRDARSGIIDVTPIGKLDLRGPDVPKLLEPALRQQVVTSSASAGCATASCAPRTGWCSTTASPDGSASSTTSCRRRPRARRRCGSGWSAGCRRAPRLAGARHPGDHRLRQHQRRRAAARASCSAGSPRTSTWPPRPSATCSVRTGTVAGVDDCVLWRIGFTGELSATRSTCPPRYGLHVWETLHGRRRRPRRARLRRGGAAHPAAREGPLHRRAGHRRPDPGLQRRPRLG